jgi:hypothetical protein
LETHSAVSRGYIYADTGLVVLIMAGLTLTVFALGDRELPETQHHPSKGTGTEEPIGSRSSTPPAPSDRPRASRAARPVEPKPKPSPESAGFTGPVVLPGGPRLSASQANEYVEFVRNSADKNPDLFDDFDAYTDLDLVDVGADA